MRSDWQTKKLSEVCQIKPPKKEAKELLEESDLVSFVPMNDLGIRQKSLNHKETKALGEVVGSYTYFADNDVLLAKITPCFENGKLGIAKGLKNGIGFGSSEYIVFRSKGEIDPEYLFYFLSQDLFRDAGAKVMTGAVGHKRVPKEFIEDHQIPLPELEEQKRIVTILDEAFAGINSAIANTEKNIVNTRELFESYLNSIFMERGDGWLDRKFGEICGFVRGPFGGSLKKACFVEEGFAVYEQQHAINDQFESIRYFIDDKKFQEMQRFELLPGDLIMSCSGTMGRVAIVPETIKRGVINQALLKLTPSNKIDAQYLRLWMESDNFMEEIEKHSQGAAIKNVASVKVLKEIDVPSPDLLKQKEIVSEVFAYREQTNQLESIYQQKLNSLKELKQSLLQKSFSGELTAEADKLMDEAVA